MIFHPPYGLGSLAPGSPPWGVRWSNTANLQEMDHSQVGGGEMIFDLPMDHLTPLGGEMAYRPPARLTIANGRESREVT